MANGEKKSARKLLGAVGEIEHGKSKKFTLRRGKRDLEALLVNFEGRHFAYINRCPHTGITLDWVNNQFFSSDHRYLMCATHGAVFEPPTGECIWGPCLGLSLQSVAVEIEDGRIYARLPGAGADE
ncbi:MAG: Rieske (2Fe-2S) protein [Candidatus Binatia bacterium]